MLTIPEIQKISTQVRRDVLRMTHGAASGHPGGSLGCSDFLTMLYFDIMKPDPENFTMKGKGEDVFFLSNGHLSPVWYSVLARYGYLPLNDLGSFRKLGSKLQGHPSSHDGPPGIRISSGSLGQGLSVAAGMALSKKMDKDEHLVYCLTGDGELQEGQNWEALMFAAAREIDNLIAVVDYNGQQIDGPVEKVVGLGDLKAKMSAFGWLVIEMDGHDLEMMREKMRLAKTMTGKGKPVMVLMKTHMGYGVDFMLDNHEWHGTPPNDEQLMKALAQIPETLGDY
ncbi:MAG: transketolase [Syntrophothermus sp.]